MTRALILNLFAIDILHMENLENNNVRSLSLDIVK